MKRKIISLWGLFAIIFVLVTVAQYPWRTTYVCERAACRSYLEQDYFIAGWGWRLTIGCEGDMGGYWQGDGTWGGTFYDCDRFYVL